jgi:uracil-DNA glycosylase family 4
LFLIRTTFVNDIDMLASVTLDELERLASQKPEALSDLSDNQVFGEGDPNAELMIIGEGPGQEEDRSGRPFVGRAGQLLDKILKSVELDRNKIYITNMVKFRPPGNRNPRPEEIEASESVMLEQIRLVKPQVIATLGNVPTQYFLQKPDGITRTHGQWYSWHGIVVFPLYHPAYLLRNPSRVQGGPKWQMWEDMKALKIHLDALEPKSPNQNILVDTSLQNKLF